MINSLSNESALRTGLIVAGAGLVAYGSMQLYSSGVTKKIAAWFSGKEPEESINWTTLSKGVAAIALGSLSISSGFIGLGLFGSSDGSSASEQKPPKAQDPTDKKESTRNFKETKKDPLANKNYPFDKSKIVDQAFPELNWKNSFKGKDSLGKYAINNIKPEDMGHPIMKGVDHSGNNYLAIRINGFRQEGNCKSLPKKTTGVLTFYDQRHSFSHQIEIFSQGFIPNLNKQDLRNLIQNRRLEQILPSTEVYNEATDTWHTEQCKNFYHVL
jgi:hypothetical protein